MNKKLILANWLYGCFACQLTATINVAATLFPTERYIITYISYLSESLRGPSYLTSGLKNGSFIRTMTYFFLKRANILS